MEPNICKAQIFENECVCNSSLEYGLDFEVNIPDYFSEAERVLFYEVKPAITSKSINGTAVSVEGIAVFSLVYTDADGRLCSFESEQPFSKSTDIGCDTENGVLSASARCGYLNVKALSPRRLSVHSVIEIKLNVAIKRTKDIVCSAECDGLFLKTEINNAETQISVGEKNAIIEEDFTLDSSMPMIKSIIRSSANAIISGCKTVENKVIAKGTVDFELLYAGVDDTYNKYAVTMPFSQILEIEGMYEECDCTVTAEVLTTDVKPHAGYNEGSDGITVTSKILITAKAVSCGDLPIVCDAFSSNCDISTDTDTVYFDRRIVSFNDNFNFIKHLDFSDGDVTDVTDLWCVLQNKTCRSDGNDIVVSGTVLAKMLVSNADGFISYYERPIEFEYRKSVENLPENLRCESNISLASVNYSSNGNNSLEVKIEALICCTVYEHYGKTAICNINMSERKDCDAFEPSFIVYYATSGENIWDIAKNYRVSPEEIMSANEVSEYLDSDLPLLITR